MSKSKTSRSTLRESYERKLMLERIRRADELLVAEHHARILLEAIDKDELAKATKILGKLQTIKAAADKDPQLKVLGDAIKEASDEVNDFTGGGIKSMLKRGLGSLAKKFGMEASANPILKSLTLLNSLETGFAQMVSLIKNSVPGYKPKEPLSGQVDVKGSKNLAKAIKKAFRPEGVFSKIKSLFGSSGGMPYVSDVESLVKGIISADGSVLTDVISAATEGGNTSSEAGDAAQDITQTASGGGGGRGQGAAQPVKSSSDLARAVAIGNAREKGEDPSASASAAEENPKKITSKLLDYVAKKSGEKPETVNKVMAALIKAGKLKSELKVTEESRMRNVAVLSVRDVQDAKRLYLESGGSSRRWVELLSEADLPKNYSEEVVQKFMAAIPNEKEKTLFRKILDNVKDDKEVSEADFNTINNILTNNSQDQGIARDYMGQLKQSIDRISKKSQEVKLDSAKSESEKHKAAAAELKSELESSKKSFDVFKDNLSKALKIDPRQFEEKLSEKGFEGLIAAVMEKKPAAVDAAAEAAGVSPPSTGNKGKADLGEKILNNPKVKSKIAAVKSGDELVALLDKIAGAVKTESVLVGRNSLLERSEERKQQLTAQREKLKKTVQLLKKIFADPKSAEKLLPQLSKAGGLQDKVKELLSVGKPSEDKPIDGTNKHAKTIDAIKDSLSDVEPTAIVKILDALPSYLMAESARRRKLLESKRRS